MFLIRETTTKRDQKGSLNTGSITEISKQTIVTDLLTGCSYNVLLNQFSRQGNLRKAKHSRTYKLQSRNILYVNDVSVTH